MWPFSVVRPISGLTSQFNVSLYSLLETVWKSWYSNRQPSLVMPIVSFCCKFNVNYVNELCFCTTACARQMIHVHNSTLSPSPSSFQFIRLRPWGGLCGSRSIHSDAFTSAWQPVSRTTSTKMWASTAYICLFFSQHHHAVSSCACFWGVIKTLRTEQHIAL